MLNQIKVLCVGAVFCAGFTLANAVQAAAVTQEMTLPNGLKVIVREDHRAPLVLHQVWYRVGSMDEQTGRTGLSHMLEHMMFRGTKTVPDKEFSRQISAVGGEENAQTSRDYTLYFQRLPKEYLELAMKLESDRMHNLQLKDELFQKEREVVHEERRWRTDDSPQGLVYERFNSIAWLAHPYRVPVIGWPEDIRRWKLADLADWYRSWYVPNNATLVVVGDVDSKAVFKLAEKYYGRWPKGTLPERRPSAEPTPDGERRITVKAPSELGFVMIGFPVPGLKDPSKDWEPYALDLLSSVLDGHNAARLAVNLSQKGLVQNVGVGYDGISRGPQIFSIGGTPKPGQTPAEFEKLVLAEIKRIADEGVSKEELDRVKRQARAAQVYEQDSMYTQARRIGDLEMAGFSWRDLDVIDLQLQLITPEQVQAVAKKYFTPESLIGATLDPQPIDPNAKPKAAPKGLRHDS